MPGCTLRVMRGLLLGCLISFAGCAANPPARAPVKPGQEFTLALGESVEVDQRGVRIEFKEVVEDSRCPMNARCIWEGNARITIQVSGVAAGRPGNASERAGRKIELNTSTRFNSRENITGFTLELRRLEPDRVAGAPTRGYVATLFVGTP
jgi:hypothetical protein